MFKRSERDEYIRRAYQQAPEHLKGTVVNRLKEETELSKRQIYRIARGY